MSFVWNVRHLSTKSCAILKAILLQFRNRGSLRHLGSPRRLGLCNRGQKIAAAHLLGSFYEGKKPLILGRADFDLKGGGDAVGVGVDEFLFAAFDEEANFGFGAGVAEQNAAFAVE